MNKIFISYSHKDEALKDQVLVHLNVLESKYGLDVWSDEKIELGDEWFAEIETALKSARIAILLVSKNFLASKFIKEIELPEILKRFGKGEMRVIPVILKPCTRQFDPWLRSLQAFPGGSEVVFSRTEDEIDLKLTRLATEIGAKLSRTATATPLAPDKIHLAKLPTTGPDLFGREDELEMLDEAWAEPHTNVFSLVAWGGVGKTALVNSWLNAMECDNYRGAERVYGWSFYSQGSREDRQVSADEFFADALEWFGYDGPSILSPWDKGKKLAVLVRARRTLLILDGLEPLQYPPGEMQGRLKDQGVQALTSPSIPLQRGKFEDAEQYLNQAVAGLREAGQAQELPRGLFARAALYRVQENFAAAWEDLSEAQELAWRGEMGLHLTDYHLEASRLQVARGNVQEAREHLETAAEMVKEMGYHRRDGEVEALREKIAKFK